PISIAWDRFGEAHTATITPRPDRKEIIPKILYEDVGKIGVGLSYSEPIIGVEPGSVAAAAGMQDWDRVVTMDGERVATLDELLFKLAQREGAAVELGVLRAAPGDVANLPLGLVEPVRITLQAAPDEA